MVEPRASGRDAEDVIGIRIAVFGTDVCQGRIVADALEYVGVDGDACDVADATCYPFGLVVAAPETASPMQGNRYDVVHAMGQTSVLPVWYEVSGDVACQLGIMPVLDVEEDGVVGKAVIVDEGTSCFLYVIVLP